MNDVERTLRVVRGELGAIRGRFVGEAVLFGSVVMFFHGLRQREAVGDVDLFVSRFVYARLRVRPGWREVWPRQGDPPLLELRPAGGVPANVFSEWAARDDWMDVRRCFLLAEDVLHEGLRWRCVPLAEVLRHKEMAGREKDTDDIEILRKAVAA